jgi:hypothetical protein
MKRIAFGSSKCLGVHAKHRGVYYVPSGSAAATDRVSYVVHYVGGRKSDLTVRSILPIKPVSVSR